MKDTFKAKDNSGDDTDKEDGIDGEDVVNPETLEEERKRVVQASNCASWLFKIL